MLHTSFCRVALVAVFVVLCAGCPRPPEDLDAFIQYQMEHGALPGLSACTIKGDEILWSNAYGMANFEEDRPVTTDTLFQLASVSKTVTATAVMLLWEDGEIDLDADINDYLPFDVRNPHYPDEPITPRMILGHRSSIANNTLDLGRLYSWGEDSPIALRDLVEGFLTPGGEWYKPNLCFKRFAPGEAFSYSNIGFALAGYLVEVVAETPFDQFCEERIFAPLGMNEAAWFLRDLDETHIAMPYHMRSPITGTYRPYGQYGYPDYPDGQLRTSAEQYARFMAVFANDGESNGVQLLQSATIDEMLTIQDPEGEPLHALAWHSFLNSDERIWTHSGGEQGVLTLVEFRRETGNGVVVFTNADAVGITANRREYPALLAIADRLLAEADAS